MAGQSKRTATGASMNDGLACLAADGAVRPRLRIMRTTICKAWAYYRCSSSKGCPARKQVERSQADPDMVLVTYSYDHNHSSAVARTHNRPAPQKPQNKEQPAPPPDLPADQSDHTHQQGAAAGVQVQLVPDSRPAPAIEVHDEFRWLYDVISVTSSTSPSDVEEADDMLMYGPMFFLWQSRRGNGRAPSRRVRGRARRARRNDKRGGRDVRVARRASGVRHGVPAQRPAGGRGQGRAAGGGHRDDMIIVIIMWSDMRDQKGLQ